MARICEYEHVKCPYCGSEEVEDCCYGTLQYVEKSAESTLKRTNPFLTTMQVHVVRCPKCLGQFTIPCED